MKEFVLQFDGSPAEEATFVSELCVRAVGVIRDLGLHIRLGQHGVIGAWSPNADGSGVDISADAGGADIPMGNNRVLRSDIPPSTADEI